METADNLVVSRCTDADGLKDIPVARGEGELRVVESEQVRAAVVEGDGYVGRGRRRQPHLDVVIVGPDTGIADGHVCGAAAFHDHDRRLRGRENPHLHAGHLDVRVETDLEDGLGRRGLHGPGLVQLQRVVINGE